MSYQFEGYRPQPKEVMGDWVREDKKPGKCCVQIKQVRKQERPTGSNSAAGSSQESIETSPAHLTE